MNRTLSKCVFVAGLALAAGCSVVAEDGGRRIDVTEPNELGVVALQTQRFEEAGNDVFLLHALAADGSERGSVRLARGDIADLGRLLPGSSGQGSEIIVSAGGVDSRSLSRETELFRVDPLTFAAPAARQLVGLAAVSSTLEREAQIVVVQAPPQTGDQPYSTSSCGNSYLNTTPTAQECCQTIFPGTLHTIFHRADQAVIWRARNPSGTACKASDGVSSCSGSACYFGPNSFSRPSVYGAGGTYANIYVNGSGSSSSCAYTWSSTDSWVFSNVTGTYPTGQGCPGGGTGAGQWDY